MSTTKFTQWPWDAVTQTMRLQINGRHFAIAYITGADEESIANAHLIGKSPEMYAKLQELVPLMRLLNSTDRADEIEALLAEARGEVREEAAKAEGGAE